MKFTKDEAFKKIKTIMEKAFEEIWEQAKSNKTNLVEASYLLALKKLLK